MLYVSKIYDQGGNTRDIVQATTTSQPILNMDGLHPVFDFDGQQAQMASTGLVAFSQNVSAASIIAVRRHDVTTPSTGREVLFVASGAGNTRMLLGPVAASSTDAAGGRRLDTDAQALTTGFTLDNVWDVEIGRWNWASAILQHQRGSLSETKNPFETTGSTANTASTVVEIGSTNGSSFMNGKISLLAWVSEFLPDPLSGLISSLSPLLITTSPPNQFLSWGSSALKGTYTLAPGITNVNIFTPSGATPVQSDLTSHRYNHHVRVKYRNGNWWVWCSSSLNNEDASGQLVKGFLSTNGGATWTAPFLVLQSQSAMDDTTGNSARRVTYPRGFVDYGGNSYA